MSRDAPRRRSAMLSGFKTSILGCCCIELVPRSAWRSDHIWTARRRIVTTRAFDGPISRTHRVVEAFAEHETGGVQMSTVTVKDGTAIYYKDWGPRSAQPLVFHHGWPLSADDWDTQMLYFLEKGYRVIAHDRRGHGRSTQVSDGHDMDHYAADAAAVVADLDLRDAIHISHSTGGGEATRYVARHGQGRVAKLVLIGAVPPIMLRTPANPGGLPLEVFDGLRQQLAANRAQFYLDFASGPFYGFNRAGATASQGVRS